MLLGWTPTPNRTPYKSIALLPHSLFIWPMWGKGGRRGRERGRGGQTFSLGCPPLFMLAHQCCQLAKFDPLSLSLPSALAQSKERKGSNFAAYRSRAKVLQAWRAKQLEYKSLAIAIWQPCMHIAQRASLYPDPRSLLPNPSDLPPPQPPTPSDFVHKDLIFLGFKSVQLSLNEEYLYLRYFISVNLDSCWAP